MAGVIPYFQRIEADRIATGWTENGVNYRSNIVTKLGAVIPLHVHEYDHHAQITGVFDVMVCLPSGQVEEFRIANGQQIFIPKWHKHRFKAVQLINGIGEVRCFWRVE